MSKSLLKVGKLKKNYIRYTIDIFVILLDALGLLLIKDNIILFTIYEILNVYLISVYCSKKKAVDCVILAIMFMLCYSLFTDVFIHYLRRKVILEAEFIYLLPLGIACLKAKKKKKSVFMILCLCYLCFNLVITIASWKVNIENYLLFMVNILTFLGFFYSLHNTVIDRKLYDLYLYLFVLSASMTFVQTAVGFHQDTRNGVFSTFGFGGYAIFLMIFMAYNTSLFMLKKINLARYSIVVVLITALFICTESKAALVIAFLDIGLIAIIQKEISVRRIFILILGLVSLPIAYGLLLKYNPKFLYLNNLETIIRYYTGNNAPARYQYGRLEAIVNVFIALDLPTKFLGIGFGGSTPLYEVFNNELGRQSNYPYYIRQYGYNYGYQHTTSSTLLLDGGFVLFIFILCMLVYAYIKVIKKIKNDPSNVLYCFKFGVYVYLTYYLIYANVTKDFRAMAMSGIVFGLKSMSPGLFDVMKKKVRSEGDYIGYRKRN